MQSCNSHPRGAGRSGKFDIFVERFYENVVLHAVKICFIVDLASSFDLCSASASSSYDSMFHHT